MTDAKAPEDKAEKSAKAKHTSANVLSATGQLIRTYTADDHGKDFEDLAKEFSGHTPGSKVELH